MTDRDDGLNRRKVLECMTWAGTGVLWTVAGGVPTSLGIIDEAVAAKQKGFTFCKSATATWASTSRPIPMPKAPWRKQSDA